MDIDYLIEYENENSYLDFKKIQYIKDNYVDLIKDVMSMANSHIEGDKYIIAGVKETNGLDNQLIGIDESNITDSAIFQDIILENIEPNINLDYTSHKFEGKVFGILKIYDCNDRPYVMRKDFIRSNKGLRKGDIYIRKGTQQSKMDRRDLDKIYECKNSKTNLDKFTNIYFSGSLEKKEIELTSFRKFQLPSQRAESRIVRILKEKKDGSYDKYMNSLTSLQKTIYNISYVNTYKKMSIEELEKELEFVKENYKSNDNYEIYELNSHKLNFIILNKGDRYLEDCTLKIIVKNVQGLDIADRVYSEPTTNLRYDFISKTDFQINAYPDVKLTKKKWLISRHIGNIKHQIQSKAFNQDLRIVLSESLIGQTVIFECTLFAKNLINPLKQNLSIKVVK